MVFGGGTCRLRVVFDISYPYISLPLLLGWSLQPQFDIALQRTGPCLPNRKVGGHIILINMVFDTYMILCIYILCIYIYIHILVYELMRFINQLITRGPHIVGDMETCHTHTHTNIALKKKHSMPSSKNKVNPRKPPRPMKLILAIFSPKKWMKEKTTPGEWLATDARFDPLEVHLHRSFCRNSITVRTWNDVMRTLDVNGQYKAGPPDMFFPQTVCPHWGVLTVGVKAGAWSGCSVGSRVFYL